MHKDELIQLHQLLVYLRKYIEKKYNCSNDEFKEYDDLNIYPHHIHRTKAEHIYAIFLLSTIIAKILSNNGKIPRSVSNLLRISGEEVKKEIQRKRLKIKNKFKK
ncbi:conserved protein of unknown function [Methanocaldococcus lauensis]|uniref:Uncharacterized protein n=1 Tax=Methanocaldococcus lauensis TaxID=2546128 RepID=A0A8D6PRP9_9EURY|nr:UPF0058 family protein [Methanocaldococcus lauensis]CAB3287187.1 conserved protein of unknown function [Methanocaldococcus lauensis]CAB3289612.1 conserved protein of unknown function [Methanocaldococcus lauensis]